MVKKGINREPGTARCERAVMARAREDPEVLSLDMTNERSKKG